MPTKPRILLPNLPREPEVKSATIVHPKDGRSKQFQFLFCFRDATGILVIRNSDRILGIWYNPESGEKLNLEHMC